MAFLKQVVFLIAVLPFAMPLRGEIISVATMKEVKAKIEVAAEGLNPSEVLAAFDIDMTLIQPDHPALYYPNQIKYKDTLKAITKGLSPARQDMMSTFTSQLFPQKLVEKETPSIIRQLQDQGIRVIAFTASLTGKFPCFPEKVNFMRRAQLQRKKLDFTDTFKGFARVVPFQQLTRHARDYPMFYHGILSSNGEGKTSKGQTLVAFLKHTGQKFQSKCQAPGYFPKLVILVDDRIKNLTDVEENLKAYDSSIQFIGIEYQGAFNYAPKDISKKKFKEFWQDLATKAKVEIQ